MTSTEQRYIEQLRAFWKRTGRAPTIGECGSGAYRHQRDPSLPACFNLQQRFGSFNNALRLAGLPTRKPGHQRVRAGGDRCRAVNRDKQLRRKRHPTRPKRRAPLIFDPHWPVILHDAKQQLERWEAA